MSYKPLKYKCPACKNEKLLLSDLLGVIICASIDCKEPDAVHKQILGLEAKKGAPQDNSESRTWPCAHILRTPKWTPGLCEWSYFGSSGVDHEAKWCEFCGAKRPEPKIWCSHIKLKGDTWRYEYISQNDPLISYQVTIEDYENFCRVCGKERPR